MIHDSLKVRFRFMLYYMTVESRRTAAPDQDDPHPRRFSRILNGRELCCKGLFIHPEMAHLLTTRETGGVSAFFSIRKGRKP